MKESPGNPAAEESGGLSPKPVAAGQEKAGNRTAPAGKGLAPSPIDDFLKGFVISLFLAAIVWNVFHQALGFEFLNYDDPDNVSANTHVLAGLDWNSITWAFTHTVVGRWAPLTVISNMLDCQFYGLSAGGHLLTNIILHTASAILLFIILWRMTAALWRSTFVAAVFAIHPLRVEAVAWVSSRGDVLSGFFFMLTLGAYLLHVRKPQSRVRYWSVPLVYAMGLMSKSILVTLPFVLLLLDYWPLRRLPEDSGRPAFLSAARRLVVEKIPLFLLLVASSITAVLATRGVSTIGITHPNLIDRICYELISYAVYLRQMVHPTGLALPYIYPTGGVSFLEAAVALVLLIGISCAAFYLLKKQPWFAIGWFWYLGMLVPVIGIVQISYYARADRYTYLSQIGLYIAAAWGIEGLGRWLRHPRLVLAGLSAAAIAMLLHSARIQCSYWHDNVSLWRHALACTTDNYVAYGNLGNALLKNGQIDNAIACYQKALAINPKYAIPDYNMGLALSQKGEVDEAIASYQKAIQNDPDYADPENNLGNALLQKGKIDEAILHYRRAAELKPDLAEIPYNLGCAFLQQEKTDEAVACYQKAIAINPNYAGARLKLGNIYLQRGRLQEAIAEYQKAIEADPGYAEAETNLGNALFQESEIDQAIAHYQAAVQIKPGFAEARFNLANAFLRKGEENRASFQLQCVLELQPRNVQAENNLALLLATSGNSQIRDGPKAVELAQQANQLTGGTQPMVLVTLAAAYAEADQFPKAVDTAQKALQLAKSQGDTALASTIQGHIGLYQAGMPLRGNLGTRS